MLGNEYVFEKRKMLWRSPGVRGHVMAFPGSPAGVAAMR